MHLQNYLNEKCCARPGRAFILGLCAGAMIVAAGAQQVKPEVAAPNAAGVVPIFKVSVVERNVTAVNFKVLSGSTSLALQGTTLLPHAQGSADVQIQRGATHVHVDVDDVTPAQMFGPEYLTYVLWAITPDGRARNLGEVQLRGRSASLDVTTPLQNFGLLVTAEPYFDVTRPSDLVVMQGQVKPDTRGSQALVEAKAELLQRGNYRLHVPAREITLLPQSPKVPLDLYEAENAVRIARWAGADQYATQPYQKAQAELQQARGEQEAHADKGVVATAARAAVQSAEDARLLSLKTRQQEQVAQARSEAASQAAAASVAREQADAAQQARDQASAEADAARQQAQAARAQAQAAQQQASEAQAKVSAVREELRQQLSQITATRETARGLIMSLSDVLFDLNQATLRPEATVKLAKAAGILETYPGLTIQVNGYTDNTGAAAYNQQLSDRRAAAVAAFLTSQGVRAGSVSAAGFGEADPVASNATSTGRQQNRRVELVVSGAVIGSGQ
ncbi:MAG TPA: OmpA family protein [Terriglobales bacterium]|jgi:outer membrane protein OmpA-like peptidoglycan-associated protein